MFQECHQWALHLTCSLASFPTTPIHPWDITLTSLRLIRWFRILTRILLNSTSTSTNLLAAPNMAGVAHMLLVNTGDGRISCNNNSHLWMRSVTLSLRHVTLSFGCSPVGLPLNESSGWPVCEGVDLSAPQSLRLHTTLQLQHPI